MRMWCCWVCLFLTGCASAAGENPFESSAARGGASTQDSRLVQVLVQNNAYLDMRIYVVVSGQTQSLGFVTGLSEATLTLPRQMAQREIQILAYPIGGFQSYVTPFLFAYPEEWIRVIIQNVLNLSTAWVDGPVENPVEAPPPDSSCTACPSGR